MCRHAAWLGPERPVASLVTDPEHGLLRQSYAPRLQRYGKVNADGFGFGWYDGPRPVRYRRTVPIWADANVPDLAAAARSSCLIAAVRSATAGMPIEETATAPFADGPWLLSHNGRVRREAVRPLASDAESMCDSAWLAAAVFARLRAGLPVAGVLPAVVRAAAEHDPRARLNLLLTGGSHLAAVAWGDTLFTHLGEGVLVASEPLDDRPGWRAVPDRSLLLASPDGVSVTPID
ncbi:gamma-glutamyl-hercynylcysteine sulfoxide hydrolase [Microbispora rosea subsp. aerata]|nr:ergothioneine biosynthesis protein EgtC [Microbispora rosea]GGO01197.1 gamma-glutamyl-hercynylcysteine sulfoxide hydrolase [Microbispora rosea subsp. aerata]GIH56387.1 gamma-glutamyl-hercynylcysteine sulfoxide hydrolase [Microbispora rosea subsp. aerata]GLJ81617.1 gamma-glutamyl-hercynylcysteine sulfoxide hydrolase [Microbispora rosea subsp. aerata]